MASSIHRIRIQADQGTVFQAVASTAGLKGWYTSNIEGGVGQGETAVLHFPNGESFAWKTTEVTPNTKVVRECIAGPGVAQGTTVRYELSSDRPGETVVKLEHAGWPEEHESLATCNTLWGILMGHLRAYAETKKAAPVYQ